MKSKMFKHFEQQDEATDGKFHTQFHMTGCSQKSRELKILPKKSPPGFVYKVYMKHKCVLCLCLFSNPKISH